VIPYNPLAGGLLSGKHDRAAPPGGGTRFTINEQVAQIYQARYWQERMFDAVDRLQALASEVGTALPTLAVAWVLAQPAVTSPILGASRPEQLDATLAAVDLELDEGLRARLDELTREFRFGDAAR